jgi:mannose-6-phosphate isomerase-like protein (cupin superfamily)
MDTKNIFTELKHATLDANAGIKVVKLVGNSDISIYVAEISSKTALNQHYHSKGIECYHIIKGRGIMKKGEVNNLTNNWVEMVEVSEGDCFSISENVAHQIENHTNELLKVVFICPESHMGDDRFFLK